MLVFSTRMASFCRIFLTAHVFYRATIATAVGVNQHTTDAPYGVSNGHSDNNKGNDKLEHTA